MSFRDMLTLVNAVTINSESTTSDGMGGVATTTTVVTTLTRAAIWQNNSNNRFLSDKVTEASSDILAYQTEEYVFTTSAVTVIYDGRTYKPVGISHDVAEQGVITVQGLERLR